MRWLSRQTVLKSTLLNINIGEWRDPPERFRQKRAAKLVCLIGVLMTYQLIIGNLYGIRLIFSTPDDNENNIGWDSYSSPTL